MRLCKSEGQHLIPSRVVDQQSSGLLLDGETIDSKMSAHLPNLKIFKYFRKNTLMWQCLVLYNELLPFLQVGSI